MRKGTSSAKLDEGDTCSDIQNDKYEHSTISEGVVTSELRATAPLKEKTNQSNRQGNVLKRH